MLVGADDGTIYIVDVPVQGAVLISLGLQSREHAIPDAGLPPAVKATGDGANRAVAFRQITPGGTGAINPQDAINNPPEVVTGASNFRLLGRQERLEPGPLFVR